MNGIEVLVISLERAEARRRLMRAQLEVPGMPPYRFIDAVDARAMDAGWVDRVTDPAASLRHAGRRLTTTEIACMCSHLQAYEYIVAKGLPATVVLEDDVLLSHQFTTVLGRLLAIVDAQKPQVILFSHLDRYSAWGGRRVDRLHRLYRPYEAYGGHAYLITSAAASTLLARLRPVHAVADDWRYFAGMVEVRGMVPYLVGTSPLANDSQIGRERFDLPAAVRIPPWLGKYVWQKFLFQIFVKPMLRLHRDKRTW